MYKAIMDDSRLNNINGLREFLESSKNLVIKIDTIDDKYSFIQGVITKFKYKKLNEFHKKFFNIYLNYHRPCLFVTEIRVDDKGKERKVYEQAIMPYEKLKEICNQPENKNKQILRDKISFDNLDKIAYKMSDNDFASLMRKEQNKVFKFNESLEPCH